MSVLVLLSLQSFVGLDLAFVVLFRWGCEPLRLRLACLRVGESGIAVGLPSFDVEARLRVELCIGSGGGFWENIYFEVSKRESLGALRSSLLERLSSDTSRPSTTESRVVLDHDKPWECRWVGSIPLGTLAEGRRGRLSRSCSLVVGRRRLVGVEGGEGEAWCLEEFRGAMASEAMRGLPGCWEEDDGPATGAAWASMSLCMRTSVTPAHLADAARVVGGKIPWRMHPPAPNGQFQLAGVAGRKKGTVVCRVCTVVDGVEMRRTPHIPCGRRVERARQSSRAEGSRREWKIRGKPDYRSLIDEGSSAATTSSSKDMARLMGTIVSQFHDDHPIFTIQGTILDSSHGPRPETPESPREPLTFVRVADASTNQLAGSASTPCPTHIRHRVLRRFFELISLIQVDCCERLLSHTMRHICAHGGLQTSYPTAPCRRHFALMQGPAAIV